MRPAIRTARLLITALLAAAALPAAAGANHTTAWHDSSSGIPPSVDFQDVAANPQLGTVIAVGRDTDSGDPAIYHTGSEGWVRDNLPALPAGATEASIDAVAWGVSCCNNVALAVGSYKDEGGVTHPVVLRVESPAGLDLSPWPASWVEAARGLPVGEKPSSIAFYGTDGLIGNADGSVYGVNGVNPGWVDVNPVPPPPGVTPGSINGIAMYADGEGYTAGDAPTGGSDRIFKVDLNAVGGSQMVAVVSTPASPQLDLAGIGASSEAEAVAIDGPDPDGAAAPGFWTPNGAGVWSRATSAQFTAASAPTDLAVAGSGASMVQAAAGVQGGVAGTVWRRSGAGAWTRDDAASATPLVSPPLTGVTVLGAHDIWAVGDEGAVFHYTELPDAFITSGPAGETTETTATFSFTSDSTGATFECSLDSAAYEACESPRSYSGLSLGQHTFNVRAIGSAGEVGPPASRTFTVGQPPGGGSGGSGGSGGQTTTVPAVQTTGHCTQTPRPLLRNVTVRKGRHILTIAFELAAQARVQAKAYHGSKLIGRTSEQVLDKGGHEMQLRYRGRGKPTNLKLLAKPAASDAC